MGKVTGQTTGTALSAPAPLAPHHELEEFESGAVTLDEWLKRRARRNEVEAASRTFVVCVGRRVVGYYSHAAGSILHVEATGKVRRNMPDPVPALLLGVSPSIVPGVEKGWAAAERQKRVDAGGAQLGCRPPRLMLRSVSDGNSPNASR
jgi:hypothetical protein